MTTWTRGAALALLCVGCGSAAPPSQLVEARAAYQQAADGAASEVAPVQLDDAREALERAEASFDEQPEESVTRDLAYIALRKAERAQAHAAAEVARRRAEEARRQQEEVEEEYLRRTQRRLTITQQQLEEERRRVEAGHEEIERQQEALAESSEALEREREARERAEREAAAALESLRQVAQVQEEQRGVVITLSGAVLFSSGSSDLLPIAQQKLAQVAQTLNDHEGRSILIEGHTDSRGSRRINERLSLERAEAVRSYLASQGVEEGRMRAEGLGSSRPVADNRTPEGRANNRRVEIVIEPER